MMLTEPQANIVWGVLERNVGATRDPASGLMPGRQAFVPYATGQDRGEFRFQGKLGSGGKLYIERQGLRVACYPEDETQERLAAIDKANEALAALWELWNGE